jgi:hypothetical protein
MRQLLNGWETDSSPGAGVSRWPWRDAGDEENGRWTRSINVGVALDMWENRIELPFTVLCLRGAGHVQLLDCLENFCRPDDEQVPVFCDKNVSDCLKALIHVLREAIMLINTSKKNVREETPKAQLFAGFTANNSECCETSTATSTDHPAVTHYPSQWDIRLVHRIIAEIFIIFYNKQ